MIYYAKLMDINLLNMSHLVEKPSIWFPNRTDTNRHVQLQNLEILEIVEEELYYPSSENKGADHFAVTAKLICAFVFAYADCWFSHEAAHMLKAANL